MSPPPTASNRAAALGPETPLTEAARAILAHGLRRVGEAAARVRSSRIHADDAAERVHQLRVATRRAAAALRAFGPCGEPRRWNKSRRRLKAIRRALGEARTCDAHQAIFSVELESASEDRREALGYLIRRARKRRRRAQRDLEAVVARFSRRRAARWSRRVLAALHDSPGAPSFVEGARPVIGAALKEVMEAGSGPLDTAAEMHLLRLAGKRLRYSAEAFAPCFEESSLDDWTPCVVEIQDRLGVINDLAEVLERIDGALTRSAARAAAKPEDADPTIQHGLHELRADYRTRAMHAEESFRRWWRRIGAEALRRAVRSLLGQVSPGDPRAAAEAEAKPLNERPDPAETVVMPDRRHAVRNGQRCP